NLLPPEVLAQSQDTTIGQIANVQQSTEERSPASPILMVTSEILSALPQAEVDALVAAKDSLEAALWERELALSDASARITELTKTISLLTTYSAELAGI